MRNEGGIRGLAVGIHMLRRFQRMIGKAAPFAPAEGKDLQFPFLLTLDLKKDIYDKYIASAISAH